MAEVFDLYNRMRRPLGRTAEAGQPLGPGHYHVVVSAWIASDKGAFLMTRRREDADEAGRWEAVTGNVLAGEGSMAAALRLAADTLGLAADPKKVKLHSSERQESLRLFHDVFVIKATKKLEELTVDTGRVAEARWMMPAELDKLAAEGQLTTLMREYYDVVYPE